MPDIATLEKDVEDLGRELAIKKDELFVRAQDTVYLYSYVAGDKTRWAIGKPRNREATSLWRLYVGAIPTIDCISD